jgi:hypothetical protein
MPKPFIDREALYVVLIVIPYAEGNYENLRN